jgi:Cu(I)/Ag(I) efflux system membrane protein CusA/SilA
MARSSTQVIEDQITFPLATQMLGLPKTKTVRGFSMFGTSFLYVVFEDGVDLYWARSRVLESLSQMASKLPTGVNPQLGPDATGVGWIFQYALYDPTGRHDLQQLRSLQDWFVRFELASVNGVSEVASVGGFVKEYQVLVDPNKLRAFNISLSQVIDAVRGANAETGGRTLEMAETEYLIRSLGYIQNIEALQQAVLKSHPGMPITVQDVARVVEGPALRRGITELNGQGEAVGGMVIMRPGGNALKIIQAIKAQINLIKQGLPEGVELKVVYDRSQLIQQSVKYLKEKLVAESVIVIFITFIFLRHLGSALVTAMVLPLGILAALMIMMLQGITANIMSLGGIAIAIGSMVDASIVMVENAHRKLSCLPNPKPLAKQQALLKAAQEVGPGLFFSLLIITVSFLPIFALTGQSSRLFTPLAFTKTYAMAAASLLSITVVPVLMMWLIRGKIRHEAQNGIMRGFIFLYRPWLNLTLKFRKLTIVLSLLLLSTTLIPLSQLKSEFMPPLDEGSLLYMPMTLPSASPAQMREILQTTNRQIMAFPEVKQVFGKAGRSDSATDPAPLTMLETWIELKPRQQWRAGMTTQKLIHAMDQQVGLPGMINSWGYPIKTRIEMLTTGIQTPVGIRISGPSLQKIEQLAQQVETLAQTVPGTRSAIADRVQGAQYIEIIPNRREIARYGIALESVQQTIQTALGGLLVNEAIEGRARYALLVRYDRPYREHLSDLDNILVPDAAGQLIPLAALAKIQVTQGPAMIRSQEARLNGLVLLNFQDRALGAYIQDLKNHLQEINLPSGYTLQLTGQFEQMQQANARLKLVIPATLLIIITLLYLYFNNWAKTLIILCSIPLGVMGGVWGIWLAGYNMSVAVVVGLIALAGIAVETAIIMLIYLEQQMRDYPPSTIAEILDNVKNGAIQRLRPKLMTVFTIILGLVPIFLTQGPGSQIMRRIALPMISGMASTFILTLLIIPVIYTLYMQWKLKAHLTKSS